MQQDPDVYKPKRDTREEVIAALRELMKLGPGRSGAAAAAAARRRTRKDKKDDKKPEADEQ